MNLFLTFDYELFFGSPAGSAEKCILFPTNKLIKIGRIRNVKFTFFVDAGYLVQLKKWRLQYEKLSETYENITAQLKTLIEEGHDIQLHIHPHWETAEYIDGQWQFTIDNHYKLSDFDEDAIDRIVRSYKSTLEDITGTTIKGFRAGGWCLQPFAQFSSLFKACGIKIDSTVFQGGHLETRHYYFDFRDAPNKGRYHFENNLCEENPSGHFLELPIGGYKYKPGFFWRLYILGRLMPRRHKMTGDGNFIPQGGKKFKSLRKPIWDHVSCDGYYASKLNLITNKFDREDRSDLVIIGHPKSMTQYSFEKLDQYIQRQQKKHPFLTLSEAE
ncbi:MAG: hypothetical protein ACQERC_09705 [Bacteroidota bacterium]